MSQAHPQPEYLKLKRHILGRIAAGEWAPHDRIPSEGELTREFGLSRMTVNRALRELAASGAITRVQGVGSFVAGAKAESTVVEVRGIRDEIESRGQAHRARVLSLRKTTADTELAEAFGIRRGASLYYSRLLHWADDVIVQLEERHVLPAAAPDYLAQDFTRTTPHHYLSREAPLEQAEHVIEAALADAEIARRLALDLPAALLILRRRTWSHGRVVSVAKLIHPAQHFRLSGQFSFAQPRPI